MLTSKNWSWNPSASSCFVFFKLSLVCYKISQFALKFYIPLLEGKRHLGTLEYFALDVFKNFQPLSRRVGMQVSV